MRLCMMGGRAIGWLACLGLATLVVLARAEPPSTPGSVGGAPLPPWAEVRERVSRDAGQAVQLGRLRKDVQAILDRQAQDPAWLTSRLQMYWQARHTQVFVKNSLYDHAEGRAPVPTVRFTGGRDSATDFLTPRLEDVKPYMGENDRLWLQRRGDSQQQWEWVEQSKTGRIVEAINLRIAELARDAALVYWYDGDQGAARLAFEVLDTYLSGIAYRELPVDLRKGHDQNIVGLQSYEVIHEDIVVPLTEAYALLGAYVDAQGADSRARFDAALKKWADVLLLNGVPWNNWNLITARFVLQIASVLHPDERYADGKGRQHYVSTVIDGKPPRHWGLQRLADFGYDRQSAMWNESASYSLNVFDDFVECLDVLDRVFGIDLLEHMPLLQRVAQTLPQYMLPNGRKVGFGDSRYELFHTRGVERLQAYMERHGRKEQAEQLQRLLGAMHAAGATGAAESLKPAHAVLAEPRVWRPPPQVPTSDFQSPTYYSANTSWLIQRNGYVGPSAADEALVVSLVGANGNHAHANGLAMELFAKGISLAPESGRGSGYLQSDYAEYYAQFPAHNTVVVDGISAYPPMKVEQPFQLLAVYPSPGTTASLSSPWVTMAEVGFIEPASQADQRRLLATVRLNDRQAYVVDVFRSRRRAGADKYHDYIFHGLGQSVQLVQAVQPLQTAISHKLSFADGDLPGYEYWFDRRSLQQRDPLQAKFELAVPGRRLGLRLWLQGGAEREFFTVKAPPSTAWQRGMLAPGIEQLPSPTLVIRQSGAAWARPFAVVMEPSRDAEPEAVQQVREVNLQAAGAVGLEIDLSEQRKHVLISADDRRKEIRTGGIALAGRLGLVGTRAGQVDLLFMSDARSLTAPGMRLECAERACSATAWREGERWLYSSDAKVRITFFQQRRGTRTSSNGSVGTLLVRPAAGPTVLF